MRNIFIILFLLGFAYTGKAQNNIKSERLNLQATSNVLTKGSWQVEFGFQYEGSSIANHNQLYFQAPKVQQRFGLSKLVELRLALSNANVFARNHGAVSSNYYLIGIEAPVFGSKIKLAKQKKWRPQIAVLSEIRLDPLASKIFRMKSVRPNLQFLFSHIINEQFVLGYNAGSFWNNNLYITYDVYLQKKWGKKLISNIEYGGHISAPNETKTSKMSTIFTSVGYFISPKVMGDLGIGRGVGNRPDYLFRTGLSFRLNKNK